MFELENEIKRIKMQIKGASKKVALQMTQGCSSPSTKAPINETI